MRTDGGWVLIWRGLDLVMRKWRVVVLVRLSALFAVLLSAVFCE